jgi:hypothetical protein
MREQGDDIAQQWQIVWDLAALEQPLDVEDAAWLLARTREPLAYRGKEAVLPDQSGLLPLWHFTLERLTLLSFASETARLRDLVPVDGLRLGLLYACGQLGVELREAERADVRRALARTWLTQQGQSGYTLGGSDGVEIVEPPDSDDAEAMGRLWSRIAGPFGTSDEWSGAVCEVMAELEQITSRWERPATLFTRFAEHVQAATPEQAAIAIALCTRRADEPDELRAEVGARYLADLDDDLKRELLRRVGELAEESERELEDDVRAMLTPSGAKLLAAIEEAAANVAVPRDTRIYLPILGQPSTNGVSRIVARCYLDDIPTHNDVGMDHLLTLDLDEVPELRQRVEGEALVFFLSSLTDNQASESDSGEVATQLVSFDQAREQIEDGTPFCLVGIDVPAALFAADPPDELKELAALVAKAPARVLGPPRFIQGDDRTEGFVMQLSETFAPANFGGGVMYLFEDDGFWQC